MKFQKSIRFFALFVLGLGLMVQTMITPAYAQDNDDMWSKLGRGISNIGTVWIEVVNQPAKMSETKRWPIAIAGGVPKGLFFALMRTLVGAYETVTFFVPNGDKGYGPILEPEFIIPQ